MDLDRLNKCLSTYEVAEHIYKVDNGKTLGEALAILEAAKDDDPATIRGAVKIANEAGEPWRAKPIKLGANRSKVRFNGVNPKPDAPTKTFNSIINKSTSDFNKLTQEDYVDNHRGAELPWVRRKPSASMLQTVKNAVLKSREAQKKGLEEHFTVNETAMGILRARAALKEHNSTVAAQTIRAHTSASEASVRSKLPPEFSDSKLLPAQRQKNNVSSQLPTEWQDAKTTLAAKQKAGNLKTWTDANNSLEHQPNHEKSALDEPQNFDRNTNIPHVDGMARTGLPQPAGVYRDEGKNTLPQYRKGKAKNGEPQQSPREPTGDAGSNIESGRGYH